MQGVRDQFPVTIEDAAAARRAGSTTAVELTTALFERADRLDEAVGSYLTRFDETALAAAMIALARR